MVGRGSGKPSPPTPVEEQSTYTTYNYVVEGEERLGPGYRSLCPSLPSPVDGWYRTPLPPSQTDPLGVLTR